MKEKLFLFILFLPILSYGQITLPASKVLHISDSSFLEFNSYKESNGYDISITCHEEFLGRITFFTINYSASQVENFKNSLNQIKRKYLEWVTTAKQNSVKEVEKDIPVHIPNVNSASGYNLSTTKDVIIKPIFRVKDYLPVCVIRIEARLYNQYRTCEWLLNSSSLSNVIQMIDNIRVIQRNNDNNKKQTEDLFK